MADSGSVLFNFEHRGEIVLEDCDEDTAFVAAIEAGADDVEPVKDEDGEMTAFKVVCKPDHFAQVQAKLREQDVAIREDATKLAYKPHATVEVEDKDAFQENVDILERCLELEDVDAIYTNCAHVTAKR